MSTPVTPAPSPAKQMKNNDTHYESSITPIYYDEFLQRLYEPSASNLLNRLEQ